jgi:DNA-binding NtrC family response regulator
VIVDVAPRRERAADRRARGQAPRAAVIAMSGQPRRGGVQLARLGARRYRLPISLEDLTRSVESSRDRPDLAPLVAAHVGNTPMRQVLDEGRGVMVDEALARKQGSRSGAARILGVSRQAVQQAVRLIELAQARGERRGRE